MRVFVVHGTAIQESRPVSLYCRDLISAQEILIINGTGVGRFFRLVNEEFEYILDDQYSLNYDDFDVLYYQVLTDREPILDDVYAAILLDDSQKLEELIPAVFDVNVRSVKYGSPLEYVIITYKRGLIQFLVGLGANVNTRLDDQSPYPIHISVDRDDLLIVQLLVTHGADLSLTDRYGRTPLMLVKSVPVLKYLLENTPDINKVDNTGRNIIRNLISNVVNTELIEILIMHGARVDQPDFYGTTPLMIATMYHRSDIVELLLSYGANKTIRDETNNTAEDYARKSGDQELADLIRNYEPDLLKEPEW